MFRNYLLSALRNHLKYPIYTLISVIGLLLGLGVAILVFLHVWQETHYDRHLPGAERVHLAELNVTPVGRTPQLTIAAPGALAPAAREMIGIEETSRLWLAWYTVSVEERLEFNHQIGAVDPNLPEFLGLEMIEGDGRALASPTAVLLSESMAQRLYGDGPWLGRRLTFAGTADLEVGGVFEDQPQASHVELDILISLRALPVTDRNITFDDNWGSLNTLTYFRLTPGTDADRVGTALQDMLWSQVRGPDGMAAQDYISLRLEPVTDLYLNGKEYAARPTGEAGDAAQLLVAATIAALILLVACVNTVNLATARSADRAHEVALRKVVGARQGQLVLQFLGEAALLVLLATLGALMFAELAAGPVGAFVGRDLSLSLLLQPAALAAFVLVVFLVILLSGLYPAFVLARYRPHDIFQPAAARGARRWWSLRTALVVFQFTASITLTILAGVVWGQVRFLESAELGFEAEDVVLLHGVRRGPARTIELTRSLDRAMEGRPGVRMVASAQSSPSWDYAEQGRVRRLEQPADGAVTVDRLPVDLDFFSLLEIEPLAGRLFSDEYGPDRVQWDLAARDEVELPVVLNVAAAESLGFGVPADVLGKAMVFEPGPGQSRDARVVGVVPNFHFKSLKTRIAPMLFFPDPTGFNLMLVRFEPGLRDEGMASLEEGWKEVLPDQALSLDRLDRDLVDQYVTEQRQFTVLAVLAFIAILIAALGLFGLLAHAVAGRRREISLRKVLGAELGDVLRLFLWQFSRPVFLAMLIAWPVAWLLASRWLEGFAYRIDLSIPLFITAGLAALILTWAITAVQVVRVAGTRPATVLRAT